MSTPINELIPLQTNQTNFENKVELVRDIGVDSNFTKVVKSPTAIQNDLESHRQKVWKHHDKLMHFGGYYGDIKVKPPFSLYYQMEIPETSETLNLKITTTLKRCWGTKCQSHSYRKGSAKNHVVRQTPYLWWLDWYWHKYRMCFDCMSPLQRHMLSQIYSGNFSPTWIINESGLTGIIK